MESNDAAYGTTQGSDTTRSSAILSRRRFLATSAVGVTSIGTLGGGTAAAAPEEHNLYVQGLGPDTTYSFTVGGNLERNTAASSASASDSDYITGQSAHGTVSNGNDAYSFTGPLYSFDYDHSGGIQVALDGERAHVGNRPDHTLVIEGFADNYVSGANYSFTVEEHLEKSTADGGTINSSDTITNQSAHGTVVGGKDAYTFDGDLAAFVFNRVSRGNPSINVLLDGEPAHVGQRPDHLLEIQGTGSSTSYTFSVNENLQKSSAHGASIDRNDQIINNRRTASGRVSSRTDAYTFDYPYLGNTILAFNFDGNPVNVLIDGRPAHVGQDFDHLLQIQGTGSLASYSFTVSDQLAETKNAGGSFDSGSGDQLNPRSASGGVTDGADVFMFDGDLRSFDLGTIAAARRPMQSFDGDLRSFDLDGKANVLLDGQPAHVGQRPDHI